MAELLEAGLSLTLVGMSVVFVLLTVLVGAVHLMSRLCRMIEGAPSAAAEPAPAAGESEPDTEIVSVVTAAVSLFRRNRAERAR